MWFCVHGHKTLVIYFLLSVSYFPACEALHMLEYISKLLTKQYFTINALEFII